MAFKRVYFIRHGESELNIGRIRQGPEGNLSERGRAQARATGLRFRTIPVNAIIASPYPRAQETAEIIAKEIGKEVITSELFIERRNPSEIVGKWADDVEVRKIVDFIDKSFHQDNVRYSDEENFVDLRDRAKKALDFLEQRPEKNILVVTHSIFMVMLAAYLVSREKLTAEEFVTRGAFNPIGNTGITFATYDVHKSGSEAHGWNLISWNDEPYVQYPMPVLEEDN